MSSETPNIETLNSDSSSLFSGLAIIAFAFFMGWFFILKDNTPEGSIKGKITLGTLTLNISESFSCTPTSEVKNTFKATCYTNLGKREAFIAIKDIVNKKGWSVDSFDVHVRHEIASFSNPLTKESMQTNASYAKGTTTLDITYSKQD